MGHGWEARSPTRRAMPALADTEAARAAAARVVVAKAEAARVAAVVELASAEREAVRVAATRAEAAGEETAVGRAEARAVLCLLRCRRGRLLQWRLLGASHAACWRASVACAEVVTQEELAQRCRGQVQAPCWRRRVWSSKQYQVRVLLVT